MDKIFGGDWASKLLCLILIVACIHRATERQEQTKKEQEKVINSK
jgi:hypothetical protein